MEISKYAEGEFCWAELGTNDVAGAKKFYGSVFGWSFSDMPLPENMGVYTMCEVGGKQVGAMFHADPKNPAPPHWAAYISCDSVDEIAGRVAANKGKVVVPPMDVMDVGRMVVFQDPTGATISAWQPMKHQGFERKNEHGAACWVELLTNNIDVAAGFYSRVFNWTLKSSAPGAPMAYTEFQVADKSVGGMMAIEASWGPMPPVWNTYFQCTDIHAVLGRIKDNGGKVVMPATKIENMGEFALISDPSGAHFSVIEFASRPAAK